MFGDRSKVKKTVKILVVDLDCCLINPNDRREDVLSQNLIDVVKAKAKDYAGFYVCTHRCFTSIGNVDSQYYKGFKNNNFYAAHFEQVQIFNRNCSLKMKPLNVLIGNLAANFAKATGLTCFKISTLDDVCLSEQVTTDPCGFGYENVLKKFEDELIASNNGDLLLTGDYKIPVFKPDYPTLNGEDLEKHSPSKNTQLIQIAKHAMAQFPEAGIELDYVDDALDLCRKISEISKAQIPRVRIRSFQHLPYKMIYADLENPLLVVNGTEMKWPVWMSLEGFGFLKKASKILFGKDKAEAEPPVLSGSRNPR